MTLGLKRLKTWVVVMYLGLFASALPGVAVKVYRRLNFQRWNTHNSHTLFYGGPTWRDPLNTTLSQERPWKIYIALVLIVFYVSSIALDKKEMLRW